MDTAGTAGTHWWQADYGDGNSPAIVSYTVTAGQTNAHIDTPREWVLQGSNDEGTWTSLATVTGQTGWTAGETRTYAIAAPGEYRYYRLSGVKAQDPSTNWVRIAQLDLRTGEDASEDFTGEIYIDAGRDLVVASKQNTSESNAFGFSFSVSQSGALSLSGNYAYSDRRYTDTPTIIEAEDRLDIYVGGTTYLLGSALNSKTGNLLLDTGDFLFDNYEDHDTSGSAGGGFSTTPGASHPWDANVSLSYSDKQGITFATVGQGDINIRNRPDQDISALNRNMGELQRVVSKTDFAIEIPGLNFAKLAADIEASANLLRAIGADIPESIRQQGAQAIDLYEDAILRGLSGSDLQAYVTSPAFREHLTRRRSWEEKQKAGNLTPEEIARAAILIAEGEQLFFDETDGKLKVVTDCATQGYGDRPCGVALSDLSNLSPQRVQLFIESSLAALLNTSSSPQERDDALRLAIECAMAWRVQGGAYDAFGQINAFFSANAVAIEAAGYGHLIHYVAVAQQNADVVAASTNAVQIKQLNDSFDKSHRLNFGSALLDIANLSRSNPDEAWARLVALTVLHRSLDASNDPTHILIGSNIANFANAIGLGDAWSYGAAKYAQLSTEDKVRADRGIRAWWDGNWDSVSAEDQAAAEGLVGAGIGTAASAVGVAVGGVVHQLLSDAFLPEGDWTTIYPRGPGASTGPVPNGYVEVSRWVSADEAALWMRNQGTAIPAGIGTTGTSGTHVFVTLPGAPKPGGTGPIRIDMVVRSSSLQSAGSDNWRKILQPSQSSPIYNVKIHVPAGVTVPK